jgi:hypothetical protein
VSRTARRPPRSEGRELFPSLDRKWPVDGLGAVAVLVAQLPDPAELPAGSLLIVRATQKPRPGLRRWLDAAKALIRKPRKAHPAVRCTALLARGYREIGCCTDPKTGEEVVWGLAPQREELTSDFTFGRSAAGP